MHYINSKNKNRDKVVGQLYKVWLEMYNNNLK